MSTKTVCDKCGSDAPWYRVVLESRYTETQQFAPRASADVCRVCIADVANAAGGMASTGWPVLAVEQPE